jgi:hypothetical protein
VLLALAKELHPHVWLNVHSGMYALFTPYDHKGHVPNTTGVTHFERRDEPHCSSATVTDRTQVSPFATSLTCACWMGSAVMHSSMESRFLPHSQQVGICTPFCYHI